MRAVRDARRKGYSEAQNFRRDESNGVGCRFKISRGRFASPNQPYTKRPLDAEPTAATGSLNAQFAADCGQGKYRLERASGLIRLMRPRRNVTLSVQHTPHIVTVLLLNVEDQIRITCQRPEAQARQVQFVGIAG